LLREGKGTRHFGAQNWVHGVSVEDAHRDRVVEDQFEQAP